MESFGESEDVGKKKLTAAVCESEDMCKRKSFRTEGSRKMELNDKELVMITEKTSQLYFQGEVEKIPKEEAICRFCFNIFQEDNVLKTKCKCKFTLIHESCATAWSQKKGNNKCYVCEQGIRNMPVT
ncbi:hypothetical protein CDL12_01860 [Handroanthus impetiginosus]|uniref:RING-CH-type domain-containing protein n=1 Tax=Handroanthus impetiginosus TaxID=429701 RepID=A0A2G9I6M4_9LAMI|nr:hypothetical protein CDL12_01860 [Handroanthus impetiginosus]